MKLIDFFPEKEQEFWKRALDKKEEGISEIRLRSEKVGYLYFRGEEYLLGRDGSWVRNREAARIFSKEELGRLLLHLCKYSVYAYEEELREGYLTLEGGHRLGVAGTIVMEQGSVRTVKNISFLNLRLAHQVFGAADEVLSFVYEKGELKNTLIVSPPGCGKTTLLRDLIRQVSEGNAYGRGRTIGVVDERLELGGSYLGVPQNDLGSRTDILSGCPKRIGMRLLLRSMAPAVLAVDELGGDRDWETLLEMSRCGVRILATMHGKGWEDLESGRTGELFEEVIVLERQNGLPHVAGHRHLSGKGG